VRRDQGGDTVSEGQSYALLLAQVAGEPQVFARVWTWAREHLLRPDGLLSNSAEGDTVRDPTPASDADLVTAWALARARGPRAASYHAAARRMGDAVLRLETASRGGRRVLTAGPWANGSPATINPSYWAFPAYEALAEASGGSGWHELERTSLALARSLTAEGGKLPPDWARIDGRRASPTPDPNGAVPQVQYGPDAQRLVVWLAASCDAGASRLAAAWWPQLSAPGRSSALALDPDGVVVNGTATPLALVGAAAAAGAAGRTPDRDRLLDRAARLDAAHPTYYGAAWVALGRALLTTRSLGTCAPGTGAS
jgi:endoglucanase